MNAKESPAREARLSRSEADLSSFEQPGDDPPPEPGFFLEHLLLAIIEAHPVGDQTPYQRLDRAMLALIGEKSCLSHQEAADRAALEWMRREHHRDVVGAHSTSTENKMSVARTPAALAREAVALHGEHGPVLDEKRLAEKFTGAYYRKQSRKRPRGGTSSESYIADTTYIAVTDDNVLRTTLLQSLSRVEQTLSAWNVPMKLPQA